MSAEYWRKLDRSVCKLVDQLKEQTRDLEAQNARLREFANDIVDCHTGTLEGCDIEEMAIKYGLLETVTVTEPCNEDDCACAELGFPAECYRKAGALAAAPAAAELKPTCAKKNIVRGFCTLQYGHYGPCKFSLDAPAAAPAAKKDASESGS